MEEATVAIATADVMVYDDGSKRWLSPDGCVEPARSQVRILRNTRTNAFRIVGTRLQDREWILNCNVYERLKYNPATPTFHQWRDEKRKVYGLSFVTEEEAQLFINVMTQAIAIISSNSEYQNGAEFGLSNGVYHEPQQLHHNAHSAPSFRDNDQDSICSSGVTSMNANTYRKSSHSVQSSSSGACLMLSSAQRRSSQGSSSSSNGSAAATTIYAASSTSTCTTNSPSRVAPPPASGAPSAPPPPPAAASSGPPPAPPLPSGGIAAISTNAPPAPPPPPPSSLTSTKPNCNSIAEQIKRVQLRKTSAPLINNANASQSRSENVAGARGRGDLFSELEATLNKRKNNAENIDSRSNGDSIVATANGTIRRAWEKPSSGALNGNNSVTDSPKTHRNIGRAPSGSSISSQEEPRTMAPSGSSISSQEEPRTINGPVVSTSVTSNVSTASNVLTVEMLEQWKREILNEVRAEINKAKNEIIDALQRR
uniref:Ena/VASP-like protein n=1 Tax=Ascaris suum TaxID=6253 RepID=F1L4E1_ASCSU